jgi:hypothetical protein
MLQLSDARHATNISLLLLLHTILCIDRNFDSGQPLLRYSCYLIHRPRKDDGILKARVKGSARELNPQPLAEHTKGNSGSGLSTNWVNQPNASFFVQFDWLCKHTFITAIKYYAFGIRFVVYSWSPVPSIHTERYLRITSSLRHYVLVSILQ